MSAGCCRTCAAPSGSVCLPQSSGCVRPNLLQLGETSRRSDQPPPDCSADQPVSPSFPYAKQACRTVTALPDSSRGRASAVATTNQAGHGPHAKSDTGFSGVNRGRSPPTPAGFQGSPDRSDAADAGGPTRDPDDLPKDYPRPVKEAHTPSTLSTFQDSPTTGPRKWGITRGAGILIRI